MENNLQIFATIFLSVLIGALPFLLIAVLVAGFIEVFVTRHMVERILPKNPLLGVFVAPLLGLILPLCECGIIPVAAKLNRKGVPLGVAVAFMLSNPIINPFPLISTRLAFPFDPAMVYWRLGGAYLIAVIIGSATLVVEKLVPSLSLTGPNQKDHIHGMAGSVSKLGLLERSKEFLIHSSLEFFSVGKFFIMDSLLAALINTFVARELLETIGAGNYLSVWTMSVFAFLISVCSEADAFVAASFSGTFPPGALLAFLVLGPMIDLKNLFMMLATFKRGLVLWLVTWIFVSTFVLGLIVNYLS